MIGIQEAAAIAMGIQGWKTHGELIWMAKKASNASLVIDVGCWRGRTTKAMAAVCPGRIIAVDRKSGPYTGDTGRNHILKITSQGKIIEQFCENLSEEIASGKVVPVFENGTDARERVLGILAGLKADFVWIDGDHDYEDVKADIVFYKALTKSGGILSGHDYEDSFPGVQRAVEELCPGFRCGLGTSWYVTV